MPATGSSRFLSASVSPSRRAERHARRLLVGVVVLVSGLLAGAVLRDPDVQVNPVLSAGLKRTKAPDVSLLGDRAFATYVEQRYFTSYDPYITLSVNQGGTWKIGDERLNTNFDVSDSNARMRWAITRPAPDGSLFNLQQSDFALRDLYVHYSPDGGETWPGNPKRVTITGSTVTSENPEMAVASGGVAHVVWNDDRDGIGGFDNVFITTTTDGGQTWSQERPVNIDEGGSPVATFERSTDPAICADDAGHVYLAWRDKRDPVDFNNTMAVPGRILFRRSDDFGQTFLPAGAEIRLDSADTAMTESRAPAIACREDGTVVVAWEDFRNGWWEIFVNISTDFGVTWLASEIEPAAGFNETWDKTGVRVVLGDGTPVPIWLGWEDARDGGNDIWVRQSADGGVSWSASVRMNTGVAPGAVAVESWDIDFDGTALVAAWADNRNGPTIGDPLRDVFSSRWAGPGSADPVARRIDLGTPPGTEDSRQVSLAAGNGGAVIVYEDFRDTLPGNEERANIYSGGDGVDYDPMDADGDGISRERDICPNYPNPGQDDLDYDGVGDICDRFPLDPDNDSDNDGIPADQDNCPDRNNLFQEDDDGDGYGLDCDFCPVTASNFNRDLDGDGTGNDCDDDLDGDGQAAAVDPDDDNDGFDDPADNCPTEWNPRQLDQDGDGTGDLCDADDLIVDGVRLQAQPAGAERLTWEREPGAAAYNVYFGLADRLASGDPGWCYRPDFKAARAKVTDTPDPGAAFWFLVTGLDGAGAEGSGGVRSDGVTTRPLPATCDDTAAHDWDGDGARNDVDNCRFDANADQQDEDGDGTGDVCDAYSLDPYNDPDGDGVPSDADVCPLDADPDQSDADGDGIGDACDICPSVSDPLQRDDDHDGIGNACDPDADNDGVDNAVDDDDDGDGVVDAADNCADAANALQSDRDGDGTGDACDDGDQVVHGVRIERNGDERMRWAAEAGVEYYSIYRGELADLVGSGDYGTCFVRRTVLEFRLLDDGPHPAGGGWFYMLTGTFGGVEGSAGTDSAGADRPVPGCP